MSPPDRSLATGWDLGGAHLKAAQADASGRLHLAIQLPCTLWRGLDHLSEAIAEAGGLTERGTTRRLKVIRKDKDGREIETSIDLSDLVKPNDVIKVAQRLI